MSEEWRTIAAAPDYEVSSLGRVRSLKFGKAKVLRPSVGGYGYPRYRLTMNGQWTNRTAHSLVAAAFIGPRPAGMDVRHLDGDPRNNTPANLVYGTRSENMLDKRQHGTSPQLNRTHCPQGHPYAGPNLYLWKNRRKCRACMAAATRRFQARRAGYGSAAA